MVFVDKHEPYLSPFLFHIGRGTFLEIIIINGDFTDPIREKKRFGISVDKPLWVFEEHTESLNRQSHAYAFNCQ